MSVGKEVGHLATLSPDGPSAVVLADLLGTLFPGVTVDVVDISSLHSIPGADCAVLDATGGVDAALSLLGALRARDFTAPVVCIVADETSRERVERSPLGIGVVIEAATVARTLPDALRQVMRLDVLAVDSPAAAEWLRIARQTQRLVAAGEIVLKMQHALNNPLAALLTEAQLLELEDLRPEHRQAVERIVQLSRRLSEVTRTLGGIGGAR